MRFIYQSLISICGNFEIKVYIYIMQADKPAKKTYEDLLKEIGDDDFFMTRLTAQGSRKYIMVSFPSQIDKKGKKMLGFPTYNFKKDRFLPAFSLQTDKKLHEEKRSVYYAVQCQKREEATKQRKRIFLSKPVSKTCYCATCKTKYDDYLDHVESEAHHLAVDKNRFTTYMEELCDLVNPQWETQLNQAIEDQIVVETRTSKKKRKLNENKSDQTPFYLNESDLKQKTKQGSTGTHNKKLHQNIVA